MPLSLLTLWLATAAPLKPCTAPASVAARALLDELGEAARRRDAETVQRLWEAVQAHRCFALPFAETVRAPTAENPDSFARWWAAGGRDWLETGLAVSDVTVVPPDALSPITPSKLGGLARLQCPADAPPSCARETAGWALRADDALRPARPHHGDDAERACEAAAKAAKASRYRAWLDCLEAHRPLGAALPAGRFRAPDDGWVVLRGRRGHYAFCDEVRAYDLKTGAAWVAQSCSGLVLQREGSVNHDATDARRALQVTSGRLPVDALREAAWLTLQVREVEAHTQPEAWAVPRPRWLKPELPRDGTASLGGLDAWFSSGQTQLAWSWQGEEGLRDSGTLTWPDSSHDGERYADALWRIAEAALQEGCAPARPPARLLVGDRPTVSRLDAAPGALVSTEAKLVEALFAGPPSPCQVP